MIGFRTFIFMSGVLALTACSEPVTDGEIEAEAAARAQTQAPPAAPPTSAFEALQSFYAGLDYERVSAGPGMSLSASDTVLSTIGIGSCHSTEEGRDFSILTQIASEALDLFIYTGDNVYGDARQYDATLPELRQAYRELAAKPEFQALRQASPMLATWDDHDYGMNDLGGDFAFKGFAETLFLDFWGAEQNDIRRTREGIYDAHIYGPEGQRVQIILLDTRYFRTALTPTDERGAVGKERYLPSTDPEQDMLGAAQWAWLQDQLNEPADLRFIVSSIQVHADGHGWEAWRTMPMERERLYRLINSTGAQGVVFVSGDRHSAGLYVREDIVDYPLYEITSSSLNMSYGDINDEPGPHRLGEMYAPVNYGVIDIDWPGRRLFLQIKSADGQIVRGYEVRFSQIGVN